ncbi:MAG: hypothetical protein AAGF50_14185, partial [Pseudomonadota bacterium]
MKRPLLATAFTALALPALAGGLSGPDIKTAIEGNTVQGGMDSGEAYAEFYEAGGAIKAEGYGGTWTIEGDQMCFDY